MLRNKRNIGPEGVSKGFSPEICRPNHDPFPDTAFPSHVENKKQEKTSNIRFKGAHSPSLERQHLHGKPVFLRFRFRLKPMHLPPTQAAVMKQSRPGTRHRPQHHKYLPATCPGACTQRLPKQAVTLSMHSKRGG